MSASCQPCRALREGDPFLSSVSHLADYHRLFLTNAAAPAGDSGVSSSGARRPLSLVEPSAVVDRLEKRTAASGFSFRFPLFGLSCRQPKAATNVALPTGPPARLCTYEYLADMILWAVSLLFSPM